MENDRVSYSYGSKESNGNYGSANVNFSYSTDVKPGESIDMAMLRAVNFVHNWVDRQRLHTNAISQEIAPKPVQSASQVQKQPISQNKANNDSKAGEFIIPIGKKYNGVPLKHIPTRDLEGYVGFLLKDGPPKSKSVKDTVSAIESYLAGK